MTNFSLVLAVSLLTFVPSGVLADENSIDKESTRARLQSFPSDQDFNHGGRVFTLPAAEVSDNKLLSGSEEDEARAEYEEFLSRGRFSRSRSIGVGYNGGGRSYSVSRAGSGRAIRTSKPASGRSSSGSFATINNSQGSLGSRGRSSGFASINNN